MSSGIVSVVDDSSATISSETDSGNVSSEIVSSAKTETLNIKQRINDKIKHFETFFI